MNINEHIIKITKSASLDRELEMGKGYDLIIHTRCNNISVDDNEDGTVNKIYKLQLFGDVAIQNELGNLVVAKAKGSKSQAFRFSVEGLGENYDEIMNKALSNIEEVVSFIKKL